VVFETAFLGSLEEFTEICKAFLAADLSNSLFLDESDVAAVSTGCLLKKLSIE